MGFGDSQGGQRFPVSARDAWSILARVAPDLGKVKSSDRTLRRMTIATGMSALSVGENVTVQIQDAGDDACDVIVSSGLKLAVNLAGTSRNSRNVESVISALSRGLRDAERKRARNESLFPPVVPPALPVLRNLDTSRRSILALAERDADADGWEWSSAGEGDCPLCAARDGTVYRRIEDLRAALEGRFCDHQFCRCAVGPVYL